MKSAAVLLALLAFLAGPARAVSLDAANSDFAAGHYHASTLGYQAVLAESGYSAPVLFDLGNSYYREGNLAQAILAYQRAQWLAPNSPDIQANLALAQKQAGLAVTEPPWTDKFTRFLSASGWAWVGCAAWTLLCLSLLVRAMLPRHTFLLSVAAIACAFVLLDAIAAMALTSDSLSRAVVVDKNASVLISPFPAAQVVFSPSPGETVTVQKAHDDFLHVTNADGQTGWISKSQIEPVIPSGGA
jgi:tetratricopeptide (TPR) repeat protein